MPKTSIAKKKLNSKNKRLYKGREKVRGIKIQNQKLVQEKMFVDKLKKLKDKFNYKKKDFNSYKDKIKDGNLFNNIIKN